MLSWHRRTYELQALFHATTILLTFTIHCEVDDDKGITFMKNIGGFYHSRRTGMPSNPLIII